MNLREFVSINADVVALVTEDLRVRIRTGWGSDGHGHDESEDDELNKINDSHKMCSWTDGFKTIKESNNNTV